MGTEWAGIFNKIGEEPVFEIGGYLLDQSFARSLHAGVAVDLIHFEHQLEACLPVPQAELVEALARLWVEATVG